MDCSHLSDPLQGIISVLESYLGLALAGTCCLFPPSSVPRMSPVSFVIFSSTGLVWASSCDLGFHHGLLSCSGVPSRSLESPQAPARPSHRAPPKLISNAAIMHEFFTVEVMQA